MKLVKILDKLTPEIVGSIQVGLPENKEFNFNDNFLLVSEDRFTLLKNNHIRMILCKDFSEVAIANIGNFDKNKTYFIEKIFVVDAAKGDKWSTFNPSNFEPGDYVFVYETEEQHFGGTAKIEGTGDDVEDTVKKIEASKKWHPVIPEPKMTVFRCDDYATKEDYDKALNEYAVAKKLYEAWMKKNAEQAKTYLNKCIRANEEFGWLVKVVSDTQYEIVADFSFETTKTEDQFGVLGKLPKEVATKVKKALGGFAEDDSIKGLTIAEIIEKAIGLEVEEEMVGKILPEDAEPTTSGEETGPLPPVNGNK